jgi:hypothetical protein
MFWTGWSIWIIFLLTWVVCLPNCFPIDLIILVYWREARRLRLFYIYYNMLIFAPLGDICENHPLLSRYRMQFDPRSFFKVEFERDYLQLITSLTLSYCLL